MYVDPTLPAIAFYDGSPPARSLKSGLDPDLRPRHSGDGRLTNQVMWWRSAHVSCIIRLRCLQDTWSR